MTPVDLINSFCADFHVRSASVLRNTVWGRVGHALSLTEFGTVFGYEDGFTAEARSLLRCRRWRRMSTVPHFILFENSLVDGSIMLIVSRWWLWHHCARKRGWHTCFEHDLCHDVLCLNFSNNQNLPRIISPTNVSRASESLIRLTLDAANQSMLSPTFLKYIYHLISAARAAEFSAEGADCSWPKLDLRPSIFSKVVDNFIDVFCEEPVTCLEDRLERRFLGPKDPSNVWHYVCRSSCQGWTTVAPAE